MGFTKQQAVDLANKYGLIPDKVATTVEAHTASAAGAIGGIANSLKGLNGKHVNVYIAAHRIGDFSLPHNADGTDNWRGGLTTLAEEGSELIRTPGNQWSLATGPMVADLPPGSQVLPHDETVRALAGVGATSRGAMAPLALPAQRGGDGSSAPLIGAVNIYQLPGEDSRVFADRVTRVLEARLKNRK